MHRHISQDRQKKQCEVRVGPSWAILTALCISTIGFCVADAGRRGWVGAPWVGPDLTDQLGSEYDNIAVSIRSGRGFSDPFGGVTGATAWMPPLIPYGLASLYYLFDDNRDDVVVVARALQFLCLFTTLFLVLYPFRRRRRRYLVAAVTLTAVLANIDYLLQITHDHSLLLFLCGILWTWKRESWNLRAGFSRALFDGLLGGTLALTSPAMGAVWAFLTTIQYRNNFALLIVAASISLLLVLPWVTRTRAATGAWVPIKSNVAYEGWQALAVDRNGVIDISLVKTHPYSRSTADFARYKQLGEAEFLREKRREWADAILEHPGRVFVHIVNRISAAFFFPDLFAGQTYGWRLARILKCTWTALCTISLLYLLMRRPQQIDLGALLAIGIWLLFLTPYLLVSYYERYDIPVFSVRLYIVLFALTLVGTPRPQSLRG